MTTCQAEPRYGILARFLSPRARTGVARLLAIVSLVAGCSGSPTAPPAPTTDCGGATWQEIQPGGVLPCEHLGQDHCGFDAEFEPVKFGSTEQRWTCTCGADIHAYWCKKA